MREAEIGLSHEGRDRQRQRDQKVKAWKMTHQSNVIPKQQGQLSSYLIKHC